MEEKLTELMPIVVHLAVLYYQKMRKPNIHDIDDLISEGRLVIIKQLSKNQQLVKAYILQCVKNHFKVLLNQTYKHPSCSQYERNHAFLHHDDNESKFDDPPAKNSDILEVDVLDELTNEQKTYLAQVIDIPIELTIGRKYRELVSIIRRNLNLSSIEERKIRRSLFELVKI